MYKVLRNAVTCLKCGDTVESKYGHDFRMCSCGNIGVDGGVGRSACVRRIGNGITDKSYIELLEEENERD